MPATTSALRIALVTPSINASGGGVSTYLAGIVPRLCDAGHQVSIVTADCGPGGPEPDKPMEMDKGAALHLFPVHGRFNRRLYRSLEISRWFNRAVHTFGVWVMQGSCSLLVMHVT